MEGLVEIDCITGVSPTARRKRSIPTFDSSLETGAIDAALAGIRNPTLRPSPSHDLAPSSSKTVISDRARVTRNGRGLHRAGHGHGTLCPIDHPASDALRTLALPGSPGRRDAETYSGNEAGRRRAIGVVADPRIHHPSDHADGTTLGRRRRPRRPGMRKTAAANRTRTSSGCTQSRPTME